MPDYYSVIGLKDGIIYYTGRSVNRAAELLKPGTSIGYGKHVKSSRIDARLRRQEFLKTLKARKEIHANV